MKKHRFGIALSGGAARGIAHLGVLKALRENNIFPGMISGSSAGAFVAALISEGYDPDELLKIVLEKDPLSKVRLGFPSRSIFRIERVREFLDAYLKTENIEDLPLPISIGLTNFNTGQLYFAEKGNLAQHLIASLSVPTIFEPVRIDGHYYVDGGLISNLPIEPLIKKCEKIIGINVNALEEISEPGNLKDNLMRTILIGIRANMNENIKKCDLYIEPKRMHKYSLVASSAYKEMFELGYRQGIQDAPKLINRKRSVFSFLPFR